MAAIGQAGDTAQRRHVRAQAYGFSADFLFKAIADQQVVADLDREVLTKPRQCRLYRDAILRDFMAGEVRAGQVPGQGAFVLEIAEGAKIQYQGQVLTISLVSEKEIVCTRAQGGPVTLTRDWLTEAFENGQIVSVGAIHVPTLNLARYSQRDLELALRRKAILLSQSTNVCERTKRYWKARQAAARANGGNEVLALVPRNSARGNRTSRLSDEQEGLILAVINKYWRSHEAANYKSCYRHMRVSCDTAGVPCPSYPTMIARIKAEETARDLRTRYGKRMAYQMGEFVDVLYYDTPQHGSRPFQYVHIDHTQADIELISGRTGKPLGRPWLSLAVDAFTGGTAAEVFKDTTLRLLPIDRPIAEEMVRELKAWPLLNGYRGRPVADVGALVDAILAFSTMANELGERLIEAEINPLVVLEQGAGIRAADGVAILAP